VWDGDDSVERRDGAGVVTARLYRHALQEDAASRLLTRDHVMSIREATDSGATVQARYEYAPFGAVTKVAGSNSDLLGFTGVLLHEPSKLFLMKRRAYDTALARWLSEDPFGRIDGPNLYTYVVNQPLRWVDPLGTFLFKPYPGPDPPNGNVLPGFRPQNPNPVCDVPAFFGWEGRSCVVQCCKTHDECFTNNRCNWTSWLSIAYESACGTCNRTAAACVAKSFPLPIDACDPCKGE
jgi:RHS repeat-associated protein